MTQNFITIQEYIKYTQLDTYNKLRKTFKRYKNITEKITAAADVSGVDKLYKKLMEEKPRRR